MTATALRALLAHAIDYAGLFPPAKLALEPALGHYAQYLRDPEAWMLGPFILPVAEFDAAARTLSQFDAQHPLRISALGPRTDDVTTFLQSVTAAMDSIASFRAAFGAVALIEQFEMPFPAEMNPDAVEMVRPRITQSQLNTFWEAPAEAAVPIIERIGANNRADGGAKLGFKLRTGGVTAEAFPSSAQIASVLVAAGNAQVPVKFTAGLHHPIRIFHESVQTKMHGFLNVLGAGVLALEHPWSEADIVRMLEDENPSSFSFTEDRFAWREWEISAERIRSHRGLVTSFGSCSFDEPRDDLRALAIL